ncbi:hypothetical protein CLOP_g16314 [Closterium sp. NIES-67]|nr:hypothetical protein CLOP_g16314 [Closterium sp. NIES-67]
MRSREPADAEGRAWRVEEGWREWDRLVGCERFRAKHAGRSSSSSSSFQGAEASDCSLLKLPHVTVQIMASSSLPEWLEGFFTCPCGLTCTLSRSEVLAARPDAMLYEGSVPVGQRVQGEPLLVQVALEEGGTAGAEERGVDVVVGYGPGAHVQCSYAGNLLLADHNRLMAPTKNPNRTIFHASSRYSPWRASAAPVLLAHPLTHRFGLQAPLWLRLSSRRAFPHCQYTPGQGGGEAQGAGGRGQAQSHFLFSLALERQPHPAYVTEKFFLPLLAGSVPIYYGAPDVSAFAPPDSFIDGRAESEESILRRVQAMRSNATAYLGYHAWRRCGVLGGLQHALRVGVDSLPCRLCHRISAMGGRAHVPHPRSDEDAAAAGDGGMSAAFPADAGLSAI